MFKTLFRTSVQCNFFQEVLLACDFYFHISLFSSLQESEEIGHKTFRPKDVSPLVVSPLFSTLVVLPPIP